MVLQPSAWKGSGWVTWQRQDADGEGLTSAPAIVSPDSLRETLNIWSLFVKSQMQAASGPDLCC